MAHRTGASAPALRRPVVEAELPADVDAFLAKFSGEPEPTRRAPRAPEEKHDPNESIDSIVARMGGEVIDVPLLSATPSSAPDSQDR